MIRKSTVDSNTYLHKALSNGVDVLLVHNPEFTKSSCAIAVGVGSLDEPDDCPGLAHFLEHMLFMGTEKYPGESMFSDFLSMHSGYSNAYTADEMTVYYCDVESSQLAQMADMFSSFFISPLFIGDAVQREISAVNSEYLNSLNCKEFRRGALLAELMHGSAPERRFSCGNSETLRQPDILERVSGFWKTKYSGSIMSLVVCGSASIQDLEKAAELFSSIPDLGLRKKVPSLESIYNARPREIFDRRFHSKIVQFAPLEDKKELHISVVLPHTRSHFRTNPLSYIEFLFTSKEPGALLSRLKSERLGFGISFGYDHYSEYTRVGIDVDLTARGSREHVRVLEMVRAFLSTIRADESEYRRLGRLEEEEFMYKQSESPLELAERLCPEMHHYPKENILDFDYLYEDFDPKLIDFLVSLILDHTRWIVLLGDKDGVFESKERFYGVEYGVVGEFDPKSISADFQRRAPQNADCFVENVCLVDGQSRFVKTEQFQSGHICLVFDRKFKVPKSEIFVFLRSPDIKERMVSLEIFLRLAEDAFNESYSRLLTNYHLSVDSEVASTGILIKFEGFASKIVEVAKLFFDALQSPPLDRFEVVRSEVEDVYLETIAQSPYLRAGEVFRNRVLGAMSSERLLEVARSVKKEDIGFLDSFYTEILAVGNIAYEDVLGLFGTIKSTGRRCDAEIDDDVGPISFETSDKNNNLVAMFYRIDADVPLGLEVEDARESDESSGCASFSPSSRDIRAVSGRLIHQICHERFFRELRTQEELGYIVSAGVRRFHSVEYLVFLVQSEKPAEFLESRIGRFVCDLEESIRTMCDEEFEAFKESLAAFYDEPLLNLGDFSSYVFNQYKKHHVDLEHSKKMIETVRQLQRNDLVESGILDRCITMRSMRK